MDQHSNFGYSVVTSAPVPSSSGTQLDVTAGEGALFPAAPFNCTCWPAGVNPLASNAEIVRVTAIVGDTLTIVRAQEGTSAIAIVAGFQIANTTSVKVFTDIEAAISALGTVTSIDVAAPAALLSSSGGPVVAAGTITLALVAQNANKVLAGPATGVDATPTFRQVIEADLNLTDLTTGNASSTKHGFLSKLSNIATDFMNGVGAWGKIIYKVSTLTYANPATIDFSGDDFKTVTLAGDIVFQTSNLAAGITVSVRIIGDGSIRTLGFPGTWTFIGAAAPASIAANKTAILSVTSFSTTDANVVAAYSVQP